VDNVQLAVLPAAVPCSEIVEHDSLFCNTPDTKEEAEDIALLLFVELGNVLVSAHGMREVEYTK